MAEQRWRISVDRNLCQGTGMCTSISAAHFRLEGGVSEPVEELVDPDDDDIVDAAESCPVEAIKVVSAEDGRVIAPEPY